MLEAIPDLEQELRLSQGWSSAPLAGSPRMRAQPQRDQHIGHYAYRF
jgi:hypothetical protein